MNLNDVKQFLDTSETCVIATVDPNGQPEAATVGFSYDDKLTFVIGTDQSTRKYANLKTNPAVALTIGFSGSKTVQISGQAKEVEATGIKELIQKHVTRVPESKEFADKPEQKWFVITPTWLRFTDYSQREPFFETTDFGQ